MNTKALWTSMVGLLAAVSWVAVEFSHSDADNGIHTSSENFFRDFAAERVALGEFRWPGRREWLANHGIQDNAVVAGEIEKLTTYFGDSASRVARECSKRFGESGEKIVSPSQENIGCLGWKLDLILKPRAHEKDVALLNMKAKSLEDLKRRDSLSVTKSLSWSAISQTPYRLLLGQMKTLEKNDLRKLFRDAKKRFSRCEDSFARVALQQSLERFLPSRDTFSMMEDLYASTSPCLKFDAAPYEAMHTRMGLLWLEKKEFEKAAEALQKAAKAAKPIEETRVLFWLGFLRAMEFYEGDGKFESHENVWWEKLLQAEPMSLHAVAARHLSGKDSADVLKTAETPVFGVYQGDNWNGRNYWSFLFVLAKALNEQSMLKTLADTQKSYLRSRGFDDALFFSLAQREADAKNASFRTVQGAIRKYGMNRMSKGVLSLLFPLHFTNEISAADECKDPALVLSLIRQESSFESAAESSRGAKGLMQLLPSVAQQRLGKKDVNLEDPAENIRAGCAHLYSLARDFDNEWLFAVAAFNAGSVPVRSWQSRYDATSMLLFADLIPFLETRHFVANVFAGQYWYGVVLASFPKENLRNSMGLPVGIVPLPEDFGVQDSISLNWNRE